MIICAWTSACFNTVRRSSAFSVASVVLPLSWLFAVIVARVRIPGAGTTKFQKAATYPSGAKPDGSGDFAGDGSDGCIQITPVAADFDEANTYEAEFAVTLADGKEHVPEVYIIEVAEAFADA